MPTSEAVAAYLRVGAMSVAIYDWLWTIPAEIAIYREQRSIKRMSLACILFILIRYISILTITTSNVGFFHEHFTESSCQKFYLIGPALKPVQTMVSQIILAIRTVAVARHARWVMWTISVIFMISIVIEYFASIWRRIPFREPADSLYANCTSGNAEGMKVAWVHYLAAMLYDATCLTIASGYIYVQSRGKQGRTLDGLSKMLFSEGLMYFCFLTGTNVLNLILYISVDEQAQSAGAPLGYAMTWIMSQGLIIHLQQYKNNVRTRERSASNPVNRPPRSGFPQFVTSRSNANTGDDVELGVHVTIEENVKVDYDEDLADDLVSAHRITTARIEQEHRKRQERKKTKCDKGDVNERFEESDRKAGKGWEVTSVGKIFSS